MTFIDGGLAVARPPVSVADFGANPGQLSLNQYVPASLRPGAPLVVLLHGCRQDAAGFALGGGWPILAERHGFALLLPGQSTANNPMGCFRWYDPAQTAREGGEVASILAMIGWMVGRHGLDRRRVFVAGLSAGGAMAAALLARAPELFAGGGIIAGLPFGAAQSASDALRAMRAPPALTGEQWADLVRGASAHRGPWPSVSIWHGTADRVVGVANAEALESQWAELHGLDPAAVVTEQHGASNCRLWRDWRGVTVLRRWTVAGLGHGVPITPRATMNAQQLGQPDRFMLESELSATWLMARDWGLLREAAPAAPGILGLMQATWRAAGLLA